MSELAVLIQFLIISAVIGYFVEYIADALDMLFETIKSKMGAK